MRSIKNQLIPQDGDNAKFPDGQIRNETSSQTGTPVVREIYGDVLANIFAVIRDAGIVLTENEDSESSQHQFLDALKVFTNELNDIKRILTISGLDISVNLDFDNLPENYVFVAQITEDLVVSENYILIGEGESEFGITNATTISASSMVLVVLNEFGTKIYGLGSSGNGSVQDLVNTAFGTPLSFNESNKLLYFLNGRILTDNPGSHNIQDQIRSYESNPNIIVLECILHKGYLLCSTINQSTLAYGVYAFIENDLNTVVGPVSMTSIEGVDNQPYMFCDGEFIYMTNSDDSINSLVEDNAITKLSFNTAEMKFYPISNFTINASFEKTTNSFIDAVSGYLYTFISGSLAKYSLTGGTVDFLGAFPTIDGVVFKFNENTYYTNGGVAVKWNL